MNYIRIYAEIIQNAKHKTYDGYVERHHIVPKCLNGSNNKSNIITLSYREHFICHWLLCKIYPTNVDLKFAFVKMTETPSHTSRKVGSWRFEIAKRYVKNQSNKSSFKKSNVPWNAGKKGIQTAWNKGLKIGPMSDEAKEKITEVTREYWKDRIHHRKGKSPWCAGTKGQGLVKAWDKGLKEKRILCPHCNKDSNPGNFKRWHGDNCKTKRILDEQTHTA